MCQSSHILCERGGLIHAYFGLNLQLRVGGSSLQKCSHLIKTGVTLDKHSLSSCLLICTLFAYGSIPLKSSLSKLKENFWCEETVPNVFTNQAPLGLLGTKLTGQR